MVEDEDLEVRVGLVLFFDAYEEFEQTGKITYLAKVCFKYPVFQKFFLQLVEELEDPHNYPYFSKKQVDKLRDRKPHGRPKKDETILDWQLTFLKYALFDRAKEYEPKDDELARRIYAEIIPFSFL